MYINRPVWKITFVLQELHPHIPTSIRNKFEINEKTTIKELRKYAKDTASIIEVSQWQVRILRHTSLQPLLIAKKKYVNKKRNSKVLKLEQ